MDLTRATLHTAVATSLLFLCGQATSPERSAPTPALSRVGDTLRIDLPPWVDRCRLRGSGARLELSWLEGHAAVSLAGIRHVRSNRRLIVVGAIRTESPLTLEAPRLDVRGLLSAPSLTLHSQGWLEVSATGRLEAQRGQRIELQADVLSLVGPVSCHEGTVEATARNVLQAGPVELSGRQGGTFALDCQRYVGTTRGAVEACGSEGPGGSIDLDASVRVFSSGSFLATGSRGGRVRVCGSDTRLVCATLDASGLEAGGEVEVGTEAPGADTDQRWAAQTLALASSSRFRANASRGAGGRVVIGSLGSTLFRGQAEVYGGAGLGGFVEVSSSGDLAYDGIVEADGSEGAGRVLLDPQNLVIDDATGQLAQYPFTDPNPDGSWANTLVVLSGTTQPVVIADSADDLGGTNAGAVYLFNSSNGALLATLTGASNGDQVGTRVVALSNGNYVVGASLWDNGGATDVGAVTFGPAAGVSGAVSAANSLVGVTASDRVSNTGITALSNGNYVVGSSNFTAGGVATAGAATWCNGSTGLTGPVTAANSLVGSTANDRVSSSGVTALTNGNYAVVSPFWINGGVASAGAVTWGSGTAGTTGTVSPANSVVGTAASDSVGTNGITTLGNGNYLIRSASWDNGAATNAGAVTWANGASATPVGAVSNANSIVSSVANDSVGQTTPVVLTNNNFVVVVANANVGGMTNAGAFTWGNGATGTSGTISAANSLVGVAANDGSGGAGVVALTNGNYVVRLPGWDNPMTFNADAGAVVFGNGTTGTSGTVTTANSLHGTSNSDFVGLSVVALTNGNYVANAATWSNGGAGGAGHATFCNGTSGTTGAVSVTNSLVGTQANDGVGLGVGALTNGNYVVTSANWANGATNNVGAATWCSGTAGRVGAVTPANSLIGSTGNDLVGNRGVGILTNGNYVVRSPDWQSGGVAVGAATWGNGATGTTGVVSTTNSLHGSTASDKVGDNLAGSGPFLALANGNYVVFSPNWDNGGTADAGAFTWCDGSGPTAGPISSTNSYVGSTASDQVGSSGGVQLTDGNFAVRSASWDNGGTANVGAVTFGDGTRSLGGAVSVKNSLVPATAGGMLPAPQTLAVGFIGQFQGRSAAVGFPVEQATYARGAGQTVTISPERLLALLSRGVDVTLQASQDITVNSPITADNTSGDSGSLRLHAGRSVIINANISLDRATLFEAQANVSAAAGTVDADRGAGAGRVANNATVSTLNISGTATAGQAGGITFRTNDGAGLTNSTRADYVGGTVEGNPVRFFPFSDSMAPTTADGSTDVTITGGGLNNAGQNTPTVSVGGTAATLQTFSSSQIVFRVAAGTPLGNQSVRVQTDAGSVVVGTLNVTGAGASGGGGGVPLPGGNVTVVKTNPKGCSLSAGRTGQLPWLLLGVLGGVFLFRRRLS